MKFYILILSLLSFNAFSKNINGLHIKTFGKREHQPLLFIHGGPDFNAIDFEMTTVHALAKEKYFVITYDQRGQGRSSVTKEENYNYDKYADDIKFIVKHLNLKKVTLLAHSHGGTIAIHTHKKYPDIIKKIVLMGAPLNWLAMTKNIFKQCKKNYKVQNNMKYLEGLLKVEKSFKNYVNLDFNQKVFATSWLFVHAKACGLYRVKKPTEEFQRMRTILMGNGRPHPDLVSGNIQKPMPGFLKNENYIRANNMDYLKRFPKVFCGIYGEEDGLFSKFDLEDIHSNLDPTRREHFTIIKNASHNMYYQMQDEFFKELKKTCNL